MILSDKTDNASLQAKLKDQTRMREAVNPQLQRTRARSWTLDEEREKLDEAMQSRIK
jgi:hypothetical protein